MDYLSLIQWPAMVINILSVWLLTSQSKGKRHAGFWISLLSNSYGFCGDGMPRPSRFLAFRSR